MHISCWSQLMPGNYVVQPIRVGQPSLCAYLPRPSRPVHVVVPRHPGLNREVRGVGLAHLLVVQLLKPVGVLCVVLDAFARASSKTEEEGMAREIKMKVERGARGDQFYPTKKVEEERLEHVCGGSLSLRTGTREHRWSMMQPACYGQKYSCITFSSAAAAVRRFLKPREARTCTATRRRPQA